MNFDKNETYPGLIELVKAAYTAWDCYINYECAYKPEIKAETLALLKDSVAELNRLHRNMDFECPAEFSEAIVSISEPMSIVETSLELRKSKIAAKELDEVMSNLNEQIEFIAEKLGIELKVAEEAESEDAEPEADKTIKNNIVGKLKSLFASFW